LSMYVIPAKAGIHNKEPADVQYLSLRVITSEIGPEPLKSDRVSGYENRITCSIAFYEALQEMSDSYTR
jgi:hypothetical protein